MKNLSNLPNLSLGEQCVLLSGLRRSFYYLHYNYLRSSDRGYWLAEIREAYRIYRRIHIRRAVRPEDRYASIVKFTTKERI